MAKEVVYDKPRIASTIVVGVLLTFFLILIGLFFPISWKTINDAKNGNIGDVVAALILGLGVALVGVLYILLTIGNAIILIFAIKNRHSTLKPIRIISYVYDGLIGAAIILCIVKILLIFVFQI